MSRSLPSARRHAARAITTAALATSAALATACAATDEVAGPDGPPVAGSVPAEFVGGWRYGEISPTNFWDDHTGVYSGNAYGMSHQYVFESGGTFKEYVYVYTQTYGCRTQAWVEMSGTVRFDGATFTTAVASGRFKTTDTCSASHNYDRAMTAAERGERSATTAYAAGTDGSGATYLEILEARFARVP